MPISSTYVISVVYTSINSSDVPFAKDTIISGSHAANSDIPAASKNTFIPFVKGYEQTFLCRIPVVCNFANNILTLKKHTLNSVIYIKCKRLLVTPKARLAE